MTKPFKIITIAQVKAMSKARCEIKDGDRVVNVVNELICGGLKKLQVLSDFDFTITKQHMPDERIPPTSFGLFNSCKSIPRHVLEETDRLYRIYRPIEIDPHITIQEKTEKMVEWWEKSAEVFKGFPFNPDEIDEVAAESSDYLRDGVHELFNDLNNNNVPLLVFSAGLGDCVVSILKQFNVLLPNVKVVSNFLKYKDGHLDGFIPPIIHIFNKNEQVLKGTEYYDSVHNRDHIILMGDSLGDAEMATGVPSSSHVLKIGFLYDHVELNLQRYMDAFDIVLINDQTMDLPKALVSLIQRNES